MIKKKIKDPRIALIILFRLSILLTILVPFLYFNLKSDNITNLFLFLGLLALIILATKGIYKAKNKAERLDQIIPISFAFSALLSFFTFSLLFGILIFDYLEKGIYPKIISLVLIVLSLLISYILFHFSNKSRAYEKGILHLKEKINYKKLFYLYLLCLFGFLIFLMFLHYIL